MKIQLIVIAILFANMLACNILHAKTDSVNIRSFNETFDFYIYPKSRERGYDCKINNEPCKYNEATVPGKKPNNPKAVYIGTGTINLKEIISSENEVEQTRVTIFRVIDAQLDKKLSIAIDTIQHMLDSQTEKCHNNSYLDKMKKKLIQKIKEEFRKNGRTEDVEKGEEIVRRLQCLD
jgi:hypothetical protein